MSEVKLTRQEVIRNLRKMFRFNYTLAPDEVFRTAIRAVQLAPDDLFKKENDHPWDTSKRGVGGSVENSITQNDENTQKHYGFRKKY